MQVVCNSNLDIIDIVARWPGSVHDSTIHRNSRLHADFEATRYGDGLLVGDAGYMNMSYLLTPLRTPRTRAETLYNEALIRTRNAVERCFGVWCQRLNVLNKSRLRRPDRTLTIIVAAAVLHNICNMLRPNIDDDYVDVEAYSQFHERLNLQRNRHTRQQLIDNYFGQLR